MSADVLSDPQPLLLQPYALMLARAVPAENRSPLEPDTVIVQGTLARIVQQAA